MSTTRWKALSALAAAAALGLTACGGGSSSNSGGSSGSGTSTPEFNVAIDKVYNPSTKTGGTLNLGKAGDWSDSVDPGDTYYGYSWNLLRNYARPLVMFKPAPGDASNQLVPDLASALGKSSDGSKTWTYKLRKGLKFEDGSPITSADVKYAVERSTDKTVLPDGPTYFDDMLNWPRAYLGPYKTPNVNTDSAIETPDPNTVVFHLKSPFAGFDYLAQLPQTAPVPKAKDTGTKYQEHVISSGPYKFTNYKSGKGFDLVRNDQWSKSTDPNRMALPDKYHITLNMNPDDVDNQVIAGDIAYDIAGTGVQPAALSRVLTDPTIKARADNPTLARLWYTSINPTVRPLNNINCRAAIMYGMDHKSFQTAFGGAFAGGDIAHTILPPVIPGFQKFDLWPAGEHGDQTKAKEALSKCGHPNGFSTSIAYRAERPKEKAAAEAFQESLAKIGIKLAIKPYPDADYFTSYCGKPDFVVKNNLGLCMNGWGADWNDGFGFLSQIVDSRVIRATGGSSNTSVRIPEVDKMLDAASVELDQAKRESEWGAIDKRVMKEAVIYPGVYAKSLLVRPKDATNVFVNQAYGMYDYLNMGAK